MAKLAASSRLPLSDPGRTALDVSWTFSLRRTPGSEALAERMTRAALDTLDEYGEVGASLAGAVGLACGYLVAHGSGRRYRVTLGVDGSRCNVCVTDYGYDQPAGGTGVPPSSPPGTTRLCQELAGTGTDGVQVHHAADGAVLVRFRAQLPVVVDFSQPPPVPGHSRSPDAHG
jgi:hypothetical protein